MFVNDPGNIQGGRVGRQGETQSKAAALGPGVFLVRRLLSSSRRDRTSFRWLRACEYVQIYANRIY